MDELRDRGDAAKVCTNVDLNDLYYLIQMRKGDEHTTAFWTRYRQYAYKVMPFGVVNALATLQTMMNKIGMEILNDGVVVCLDDILIYSENKDHYIKIVQKGLDRLERHDLGVLLKRSVFHLEKVEFLGYIVKSNGVTLSEGNEKRVQNWAHPRSVKEV